jgi:hypothetical protein
MLEFQLMATIRADFNAARYLLFDRTENSNYRVADLRISSNGGYGN